MPNLSKEDGVIFRGFLIDKKKKKRLYTLLEFCNLMLKVHRIFLIAVHEISSDSFVNELKYTQIAYLHYCRCWIVW